MNTPKISHPSEHAMRWQVLKEKGREDAKYKREDRFLAIAGCHCAICKGFYQAGWELGVRDLFENGEDE